MNGTGSHHAKKSLVFPVNNAMELFASFRDKAFLQRTARNFIAKFRRSRKWIR
jgi:hypothetical protein